VAAAAARRQVWSVAALSVTAIALAGFAAPRDDARPAAGLAALLFLGSSVHVASTACLFGFSDVRAYAASRPARYLAVPAALVTVSSVAAMVVPSDGLSVGLLGYFGWQLHHYQKQNLGLAALAAAAHRVPALVPTERHAIAAAGWTAIASLCLRPSLLQLDVNPPAGSWLGVARVAIAAAFGGCAIIGWRAFARRESGARPPGLAASYAVAVLFPLPIFVFRSPYAALAGITIAHGLQYLLLVGRVSAGPRPHHTSAIRILAIAGGVLAAGAALSLASHLHHGGLLARAAYGAYLGVVMTHFVVDAGLWRMRDPFPRRFLTARLPDLLAAQPVSACDVSAYGVASAA
jgi:hypothetical protein